MKLVARFARWPGACAFRLRTGRRSRNPAPRLCRDTAADCENRLREGRLGRTRPNANSPVRRIDDFRDREASTNRRSSRRAHASERRPAGHQADGELLPNRFEAARSGRRGVGDGAVCGAEQRSLGLERASARDPPHSRGALSERSARSARSELRRGPGGLCFSATHRQAQTRSGPTPLPRRWLTANR